MCANIKEGAAGLSRASDVGECGPAFRTVREICQTGLARKRGKKRADVRDCTSQGVALSLNGYVEADRFGELRVETSLDRATQAIRKKPIDSAFKKTPHRVELLRYMSRRRPQIRSDGVPFFKSGRVVRNRCKIKLRSRKRFIAADTKRMIRFKTGQVKQSIIVFPKSSEKLSAIRVRRQERPVVTLTHKATTSGAQQLATAFQDERFVTLAVDFHE